MTGPPSRRTVLRRAALTLPLFAGCSLPNRDAPATTTPESYPHLEATATYLADGVDVALPASVPRAETPGEAGLAVFPPAPDTEPGDAVTWLVDGTAVAVLGRPADEFLLRVQRSEAADEAFGRRGYGVSDRPPHLQVAFGVGGDGEGYVSTHSYTWGDLDEGERPSDERVLESLDEALADGPDRTAGPA